MKFCKQFCLLLLLVMYAGCVFGDPSADEIAKIKAAIPAKATMKPAQPRTVLVFSLCKGFKHSSIPYWDQALVLMGEKTGAYKATVTYDMNMLKPENLNKFDALVLNNTTRLELQKEAPVIRQSMMDFIKGGKGIMGIHAATDNFYDWPEMQEIMGGKFTGHPWGSGSTVSVKLDDPGHPLMKAFEGKGFKVKDEIYLTDAPLYSRDKARVLMSLDMSDAGTADVDGGKHKDADVGLTWIKSVGKGRLFYGSLGHNNEITWVPSILQHYLDGLQFVLGDYKVDTTPLGAKKAAMADIGQLKTLLAKIADYDYGHSREELTQFSDFMRGIEGTANLGAVEKELLVFLQSHVTTASKQQVCRSLSIIGTEASGEVLAGLLTDAETADMARYALERIPGQGIDEVLRKTLPKTKGVEKVGVISTLGMRGDMKSVPVLAELIGDGDSEVAAAAVTALGQINSPEATAAISKAKDSTSGDLQLLVLDSYLNCADRLVDKGDVAGALRIYKELYTSQIPQQIRSAAFRGMVYSVPERAGQSILEAVKSGDSRMQEVAFGLVGEIRDDGEIKAIADELPNLGLSGQVQLITALANQGSVAARPAVVSAVTSENGDVRIAALKALASLGDESTVAILAEAAGSAVGAERVAARESLYSVRDPDVDAKVLGLIGSAPELTKVELIRSISERNIKGSLDILMECATDKSNRVQLESYKVLKDVAGPDQIEKLVGLLTKISNSTVRTEAERTVAAVAGGIEDKSKRTEAVVAALGRSSDPVAKASLLMVLGRIGEDSSLDSVYAGCEDDNQTVREAAIKALGEWPNSRPADRLVAIAQGASDARQRILALRGYVSAASLDAKTNPTVTLERFRKAMAIAAGTSEKRMVLAGISLLSEVAALEFVGEYINDPELALEGQAAVVRIAGALAEENPAAAVKALKQVVAVSQNDMLRQRAQTALDEVQQ